MGFFSRIFNIGKAEAHSVASKMEDPIKMTEQGIRDLKNDLSKSMNSLAEVKASANSLQKKEAENRKRVDELTEKAKQLVTKAKETGDQSMEDLARQVLQEKSQAANQADQYKASLQGQEDMIGKLQLQVDNLRSVIRKQENKLTTLKARAQTAQSLKKVNKQLSAVDSSSTMAMLERMEEKVSQDESKAQAYGDIAAAGAPLEDKVNTVLNENKTSVDDELAALKDQLK